MRVWLPFNRSVSKRGVAAQPSDCSGPAAKIAGKVSAEPCSTTVGGCGRGGDSDITEHGGQVRTPPRPRPVPTQTAEKASCSSPRSPAASEDDGYSHACTAIGRLLRDAPEIFVEHAAPFLSPADVSSALAACSSWGGPSSSERDRLAAAAWRSNLAGMVGSEATETAAAAGDGGGGIDSDDPTARRWKGAVRREHYLRKQYCSHTITPGRTADVGSIAAMGDDSFVAAHNTSHLTGGEGLDAMFLWDAVTGDRKICYRGHKRCVRGIARLQCGRFASMSEDRTIRVWDSSRRDSLLTLETTEFVGWHAHRAMSKLSDNTFVTVGGGPDRSVCQVWDVRRNKGGCVRRISGDSLMSVCGLASGSGVGSFAMGNFFGVVSFWDVGTGKCISSREGSSDENALIKVLSVGNDAVLSVTGNGELRRWDATSHELVSGVNLDMVVRDMTHLDSGRILLGGGREVMKCWDMERGEILHEEKSPIPISSLARLNEANAILGHSPNHRLGSLHGAKIWKAPRTVFE